MALAFALLVCAAGCTREHDHIGRIAVGSRGRLLLVERGDGTLLALDGRDGKRRWVYDPQLELPPQAKRYTPRLACAPIETRAGALLLHLGIELHQLDAKRGRLRWRRSIRGWESAAVWDGVGCPVGTPDSGLVIVQWGPVRVGDRRVVKRQGVQKLAPDGADRWHRDLARFGKPVRRPRVSPSSGDVLVRTRQHVISISPRGTINWHRSMLELR